MPAILLTVAAVGTMAVLIHLLVRDWPHSSRHTGYHVGDRDDPIGAALEASEAPPVAEDDDARWNWSSRPGRP